MEFQNSNTKFFSYVILLISFFILVFITRPFFYTLQEHLDEKSQNNRDLETARAEHMELEDLKLKFESNQDELLKNVSKYTIDFNPNNLFNYIYTYVDSVNSSGQGTIVMRGLTFNEGTLGDLGMYEGELSVTASFSSQRTLLGMLEYFVSADSQYTFFIDNFSYSNFGQDGSFQVTIPLKLFYKK